METRKLGNSDLLLTPVGYGAWAIGGGGWQFAWGPQKDDDSVSARGKCAGSGYPTSMWPRSNEPRQ